MNLEQKIMNDIKTAMLEKDVVSLEVLRAIKSEILLLKTNKESAILTEEREVFILQKLLKQRLDAAKIYSDQERLDLAEHENKQGEIILSYLPQPYTEEEISNLVDLVMRELNITSKKQMGQLMSTLLQRAKGRVDGKTLSDFIKKKLD